MDFSVPYTVESDVGLGISFVAEFSSHVFEVLPNKVKEEVSSESMSLSYIKFIHINSNT